ncbi:MAG: hypothetical protein ACR2JB_26565 [Bryobacteraceae bacterium]
MSEAANGEAAQALLRSDSGEIGPMLVEQRDAGVDAPVLKRGAELLQ